MKKNGITKTKFNYHMLKNAPSVDDLKKYYKSLSNLGLGGSITGFYNLKK